MSQNTSSAVMNQRSEPPDSLDDFPTPPWATRALFEHVLKLDCEPVGEQTVWEPCCGRGDMVHVLVERFRAVIASDVHDYSRREISLPVHWMNLPVEFIGSQDHHICDWIITNPPFNRAEELIKKALVVARVGIAVLVRTNFIEGQDRYRDLYSVHPPAIVAQFAERVPMFRGRLHPEGRSATSYCWIVFRVDRNDGCNLIWIPPCRQQLEEEGDYAPYQVGGEFLDLGGTLL